jgi:hypothetical protein
MKGPKRALGLPPKSGYFFKMSLFFGINTADIFHDRILLIVGKRPQSQGA